jgi:acyl dehydratase
MTSAAEAAEALAGSVGALRGFTVRRVEAQAVARFAEAIGDDDPGYHDPEVARGNRWGGAVAPPTFLGTIRADAESTDIAFGSTTLNGGESYELLRPVRVGDVIAAAETLESVRATSGRSGEMLIITTRTEYRNADNVVVGRRRSVTIKR